MLGGIDPIIIFNVGALPQSVVDTFSKIPVVKQLGINITRIPIPVYLSERLTGILIDSEDKHIDIGTSLDADSDSEIEASQKTLNSSVTITAKCKRTSIGLILLSSMFDLIFKKVTSKDYSITYLNGVTTIFGGYLQSFNIIQDSETDMAILTIVLSTGDGGATKDLLPKPLRLNAVLGATPSQVVS
jgi:hypothetical protein